MEINYEEKATEIKIDRVNKPIGPMVFVSLIFLTFFGMLLYSFYQLIIGDLNTISVIVITLFYYLFYSNFRKFYLIIAGDEKIEIFEDYILYYEHFLFFRKKRKFMKSKMKGIMLSEISNSLSHLSMDMLKLSYYYVKIVYRNKTVLIGKTVTKQESEIILQEFKKAGYLLTE